METKICKTCNKEFDINEFVIGKSNSWHCRICRNKRNSELRLNNLEKYREYSKKYNRNNRDKINEYNIKTQDKLKQYRKDYYQNNKEELKKQHKEYYENNKEQVSKCKLIYEENRMKTDGAFNLKKRVRTSIRQEFNNYSVNGKLLSCVNYGIEFDLIFNKIGQKPGKQYELDHIIPLCLFNFDDPIHVRLSHAPENLQWITKEENNIKSDVIIWDLISLDSVLVSIATSLGINETHNMKRARDIVK